MRGIILTGLTFLAALVTIPSNASMVPQNEMIDPEGVWEVVALRRPSDVSGPPAFGDTIGLMGKKISFGPTLKWVNGTECKDWKIVPSNTPPHSLNDPILSDVTLPHLAGPDSDGDKRVWLSYEITCEDKVIAQVTRVDGRVMITSTANGLLNIIIQKPLDKWQVKRLQAQLKDRGLYGSALSTINGIMDSATQKAIMSYAAHRNTKYVFKNTVITENLLDGLGVLTSNGRDQCIVITFNGYLGQPLFSFLRR